MKLIAISFILFVGSFLIHAQTEVNADIGILYGSHELYRMNIAYRKSINDKYKLRLGAILGSSNGSFWNNSWFRFWAIFQYAYP